MQQCSYQIQDQYGLHARPAGLLAKLAAQYNCKITLARGERSCDPRKLITLMALGVKQGDTVVVQADGPDEAACIQAVADFLAQTV